MTKLRSLFFVDRKKPVHIWDIEVENFAWIDFFWSVMGRSGEIGQGIELIYKKLDKIAVRGPQPTAPGRGAEKGLWY